MRLSFSNLAWDVADDDMVLDLLAAAGIEGLELAPVKVFGDLNAVTEARVREYRRKVEARGLAIVAFQAYLFGRPELRLFDDATRRDLIELTKRAIDVASWCGAGKVVYGAPKSRARLGRAVEECTEIAREAFAELGAHAAGRGVVFCLEPNPPAYECDFASNAADASALVRAVGSPGFRLHLDVACMTLAGDDIAGSIARNADILSHFHATEPNLGDLSSPALDHAAAATALRRAGYAGWVSVEMKPPTDGSAGIRAAAEFVRRTYGGT